MKTIKTKPYDNVTEVWLTRTKCDKNYNNVFYPNNVNVTNRKASMTAYINELKYADDTLHYTDIPRPIRYRGSFVAPVNLETAKTYNYVIYRDKQSNFKRDGSTIEHYCFITDYYAINDELTGFILQTDVWTEKFCFGNVLFDVNTLFARTHVKNDTIGLWRIPEGITATRYITADEQCMQIYAYMDADGDWHYSDAGTHFASENCMLLIFTTDTEGWSSSSYTEVSAWVNAGSYNKSSWNGGFTGQTVLHVGHVNVGQAYSGLHCFVLPYTATRTTIEAMTDQNIDRILNIITVPQVLIHSIVGAQCNDRAFKNNSFPSGVCLVNYQHSDTSEYWQGYTPANNKQYEDLQVVVTDGCGTTNSFKLTDFYNRNPVFRVTIPFAPDCALNVTPCNYNRKRIENASKSINVGTEYFTPNYAYSFSTTPMPNNSFTSDAYQAYLAQNGGLDNMYKQVQLSNAMTDISASQSIAQQNLTISQNQNAQNYANQSYDNSISKQITDAVSWANSTAIGQAINAFGNWVTSDNPAVNRGVVNTGQSMASWQLGGKQAEQNAMTNRQYNYANQFANESISNIRKNANLTKQQNELSLQMQLTGAKALPDSGVTGTCTGHAFESRLGLYVFTITPCYIDAVISDFMYNKFGYVTNEYITRGVWNAEEKKYTDPLVGKSVHNYVQTCDVKLYNGADSYAGEDDLRVLEEIFNNGVHIWHNSSNIRDYSSTNTTVTTIDGYTMVDGIYRYSGTGF